MLYVTYDVSETGKVTSPLVKKTDYYGPAKYKRFIEKAAIRAVERQKFDPRTINGEAVIESARTTRITFNLE